jgi:hypothetical protein
MAMAQLTVPSPTSDVKSDATQVGGSTEPQSQTSTLPVRTSLGSPSIPNFRRVLEDAMLLLTHAAEIGMDVDETTRTNILKARAAANPDWNYPDAAGLLAALSVLAAKLKPVTADSLRAASMNVVNPDIRSLRRWTCVLALPIILFSVSSFVSSSISSGIRSDITAANELLVKLRAELGTSAAPTGGTPDKPALPAGLNEGDVLLQLQTYASTVRAIDARARQLNWFVLNAEHDPFASYRWNAKLSAKDREANQQVLKSKFQLPVGLPNMPQALDTITTTFQDVRSFAQDMLDLVSVYYGAVTACLLPILYALLGTCAYLLRNFEEELRSLTFVPSSKTNWARFLMAGISGAVVGLFNFVLTQGTSVSPLAIAFLVGYAVDVFFSFLEGLLQSFTKSKTPVGGPAGVLTSGQKT